MNRLLACVFAASILTPFLHANIVTNGSFESLPSTGSPSLLPGDSTSLPGWTVLVAELAQISPDNTFGITASDGGYSLDLSGYHDSFPYGGVEQSLSTIAGATYSIQFDVGTFNGTSSVQVSVGDLVDVGSSTNVGLLWTTFSGSFTASGTSSLLDLVGTVSGSGNYIGLDNVVVNLQSLPASTPEPASFLLLGCGVGVLALVRRKTQALFSSNR
jgi:hypothetical protein